MKIISLTTLEEVQNSFSVFRELRTHLIDSLSFAKQIMEQRKEGYNVIAVSVNDEIVACCGFRFMIMLAFGKILYIDDLVTQEKHQGKGDGKALIDYVKNIAQLNQCSQIHLDSGYKRNAAHKLYLNYGFERSSHHFIMNI